MKFNEMNYEQRSAYLAGGRVTTEYVYQFGETVDGGWVPKIRGLRIGQKLFATEDEAKEYGVEFRKKCADAKEIKHED